MAFLRPIVTEVKRQAIGVDVGGTKIAAGVVAADGTIIEAVAVPTPLRQDALVQGILDTVSDLRCHYPVLQRSASGRPGWLTGPAGTSAGHPTFPTRIFPCSNC